MFIGLLFNVLLYGIMIAQCYIYYSQSERYVISPPLQGPRLHSSQRSDVDKAIRAFIVHSGHDQRCFWHYLCIQLARYTLWYVVLVNGSFWAVWFFGADQPAQLARANWGTSILGSPCTWVILTLLSSFLNRYWYRPSFSSPVFMFGDQTLQWRP